MDEPTITSETMQSTAAAKTSCPRSRRAKIVLRLLYVFYVVVLAEIGARAFWSFNRGVPFFRTSAIWYAFYPEVKNSHIYRTAISNTDETFDVLVLGGSVLHDDYGGITQGLKSGLQEQLGRPVRVFNLAFAGKTSRDSLIKYRSLNDRHFDLVIFYHGINDTRMNNCPPELYRDDYAHCSWYRKIYMFQEHPEKSCCILPYSLGYLCVNAADRMRIGWYIPRLNPNPAWVEYGRDIKTAGAFRSNLSEIIETARTKNERVLVMTFAYHIPPDYTEEKFRAKQLDYGGHNSPLAIWGKAENVARGMDAHNVVVKDLVRENPDVFFIDQHAIIPKGARTFDDCCHFTEEGCKTWLRNVLDGLRGKL